MTMPRPMKADVRGKAVSYWEAGTGPAVMLLHGIGSAGEAWDGQLVYLGQWYRTIAWDAPGYGGSDPLDSDSPDVGDYADMLAGLMDAVGIPAAHLVGNSLGALMIGGFVHRYPERALSMVLSDVAAGHGRLSADDRETRLRARLHDLDVLGPEGMALKRAPNLLGSARNPEAVEKVASTMAKVDPRGYSQAAHMLSNGDIFAELEGCTVPAMVLCGSDDRVTPPEGNKAVAAALPGSRYVELPRVGHLPYIEAADAFNRLVADFLAEQAREPAA